MSSVHPHKAYTWYSQSQNLDNICFELLPHFYDVCERFDDSTKSKYNLVSVFEDISLLYFLRLHNFTELFPFFHFHPFSKAATTSKERKKKKEQTHEFRNKNLLDDCVRRPDNPFPPDVDTFDPIFSSIRVDLLAVSFIRRCSL